MMSNVDGICRVFFIEYLNKKYVNKELGEKLVKIYVRVRESKQRVSKL